MAVDVGVPVGVISGVIVGVMIGVEVGVAVGTAGKVVVAVGVGVGGEIESFTAKDPQYVGLGQRAIDVVERTPIVFGDRQLGARVMGIHPCPHQRNQMYGFFDPTLIQVGWIPE